MSKYYNSNRKTNIYTPGSDQPFKLSRSKLELFINCPRCFYLDRRLGIARPPSFPFTLNSAVDKLLKKEFDIHRANGEPHPLIKKYGIDAHPVHHEKLDIWRDNFRGVEYHHKPTNLLISGAIDDLWINSKNEYIVVDYKATATQDEINELTKDHHESYKRQMEIYQWLLRQNGYKVSPTGYFVYANGRADKKAFDGKLEFAVTLIPYKGNDSWVEDALQKAHKCLNSSHVPPASKDCDFCSYRKAASATLKKWKLS